ncbi:MAG: hypothetical protein GY805_38260 [Chloroflexi bacterium]|nr:hypothetical protein [Chloroflexota bacterium]
MSYKQRSLQRIISYYAGLVIVGIGTLSFVLIMILALLNINFPKMTEFAMLALSTIGFGTVLSVIFSHSGWHRSFLIDFLLNQLSILLTLFGFVQITRDFVMGTPDKSTLLMMFIIFCGLLLAGLGMKFSNSPSK